jgi:hypothetical protein
LQVIEGCGKGDHEITPGDSIFRIAAIYGVSGESRCITEVFKTPPAIPARPVSASKPADSHTRAKRKFCRSPTGNFADNLMSGNHFVGTRRQFAFDNVQVRPANSTGAYAQKDVTGFWSRLLDFVNSKRALGNVGR